MARVRLWFGQMSSEYGERCNFSHHTQCWSVPAGNQPAGDALDPKSDDHILSFLFYNPSDQVEPIFDMLFT